MPILDYPKQDHYFTLSISDIDYFVQITSRTLMTGFKTNSGDAVELFKVMVGAECKGCEGITTGEQIQMVGTYQQSAEFSSASDFYMSLVNGNCPKCSSDKFSMKWSGRDL